MVSPALLLSWLLSNDDRNPAYSAPLTVDAQPSITLPSSLPLLPLAGDDFEVAAWWRRIAAFLIDNCIVSLVFQVAHTLMAGPYEAVTVPLISILTNLVYEVTCYTQWEGRTLGKRLLGIRVVRDDGMAMDVGTSTLVWGGKLLNLVVFVDVLYGMLNLAGENKCLHNLASGTTVVRKVTQEESSEVL